MKRLKLTFESEISSPFILILEGSFEDDIAALLDEHMQAHPDDLPTYSRMDLLIIHEDEDELDRYIPINGGEFYIPPLIGVEEIEI